MTLPATFPDLVSLDLFASTVRLGSQSAAAVEHGMSQPSVSARIRNLERQLGLTLLDRSPTGSSPTEHGALVSEWIDSLLASADDLASGVATLRSQTPAALRVAASYTVAEFLLPRWVTIWRRRHPGSSVEMSVVNSSGVIDSVRAGVASVGFIESSTAVPDLHSDVVASDELVVVVAADHPWASRKRPLTARQLSAEAFVFREAGSGTREVFANALRAAGSDEPEAIVELGSTTAVRETVAGGLGPAALSRLAVASDLTSGRLIEVRVSQVDLRREIRAIWPTRRDLRPRERELVTIAADSTGRPDGG